jgi:hypothetical protein
MSDIQKTIDELRTAKEGFVSFDVGRFSRSDRFVLYSLESSEKVVELHGHHIFSEQETISALEISTGKSMKTRS